MVLHPPVELARLCRNFPPDYLNGLELKAEPAHWMQLTGFASMPL
jgi:hypothetical protein